MSILLGSQLVIATVDPFYLQALEKGKNFYFENQLEPALESLKIAEFGLLAEIDLAKEVYVFQALCFFKLNKARETKEVLDRIKGDFRVDDLLLLEVPEPIKPDWEQLVAVMEKRIMKPVRADSPPNVRQNLRLASSFESIYQQARELIQSGNFGMAEIEIKKLKKMNKKDIRIDYLKARICFEKKKYPDCVQGLRKVFEAGVPKLRGEVLYYLVISYYFTGNYGQALAFFQKIENPSDRQKLDTIIQKVKAERKRLVEQVSDSFTRSAFKKMVERFQGDLFLANDILTLAMKNKILSDPMIEDIIRTANRYSRACNMEFYLNASGYYRKMKKIKSALDILKNSRYYGTREVKYIEVYYRVGELYFQMKEWTRAMVEMVKVKAIKEGYKESDRYIENIQKLKQGG